MAGRGRGRGRGVALNLEQITGIKTETKPQELLVYPPPKFPPMDVKPVPFFIDEDKEMGYMNELKRIFAEYTRDSEFHVNPVAVKKDIERYSDRYSELIGNKTNYETMYNWSRLPNELRSTGVKRKKAENKKTALKKLKKWVNVEDRLKELEKKETAIDSEVEKDEENEKEAGEEDEEKVEAEEEDVDEEMDEGTDYANNYFDNGEGYDDEDDNLDDEQTYS